MPRRLVLAADHARERVDKVLSRQWRDVSRATLQRWISEGRVQLDGRVCRARDLAGAGAVIEVEPGPAPTSQAEPDDSVHFDVVYEDEHLIVVNKPAGLVVHPARGHRTGTLVNGLLARPGFRRAPTDPRDPEGALRPGVVHRLDRDTSGVLVVAKDEAAREGLKAQLGEHRIERVYRALTRGVPDSRTIRTLHARHPRSRLRFTSRAERGRVAITRVETLECLAAGRAALVECRLETGRTHQIRVHLLEQAGTPVLADRLYGSPLRDSELSRICDELGRHALHAAVLGFVHPITTSKLRFEVPLPTDMQRALEQLRSLASKARE